MKNPLLDKDFLLELDSRKEREVYIRITALTWQELPIEYIEGKATGGSVNVDGASAVRRTCSLTMIAQDVNINDFYWGLKNKFKLEIGLRNTFNSSYPEIIWFKQGVFIITSFSTSQSTNNYTINISGKDKMCLLNGDIAGALPHSVDFGVEEYYDMNGITHYEDILIKNIIREAVQNYGNELAQNIIINDLEDAGVEVLEYRGDKELYLFKNKQTGQIDNMTINEKFNVYVNGLGDPVALENISQYDTLIDLEIEVPPIQVTFERGSEDYYTIVKVEYGSVPGYRLTDLTYAGELIANVGESLTSVLDKIVKMLGEFEYFYDIDGRFIFRRKQNYVDIGWNNIKEKDSESYVEAAVNTNNPVYSLTDAQLITAFQNTPNLLNLRNDFSVWGKKKSEVSDTELPIHMRYAIDKKPTKYTTIRFPVGENTTYKTIAEKENDTVYDWRELIYQMAKDYRKLYHEDDFLFNLAAANPQYPDGHTGYEQYYVDMEGFWRELYNPFEKDEDNQRNLLEQYHRENYWIDDDEVQSNPQLKGWSKIVTDNPEALFFWIDFLDNGNLAQYSVPAVGNRTKAVNDDDVNAIYFREIPTVIFTSSEDASYETQTGYTYINLPSYMTSLFTITSKRKSAYDAINDMLYKYSYCIESANITTIPIYYLEPNHRIQVRDDKSGVNGEYIINKLTIPLTYNGTMSIQATKAVNYII